MNNDLKNMPQRFRLESVDFWLARFEKKIDVLASNGNSPRKTSDTSVALSTSVDNKPAHSATTPDYDSSAEPQIYLRTLLEFLLQYYDDCMTCLTPGIVTLFPMLIEYANEDESESNESFKDIDIRSNASLLVHEYMSSLLVNMKFAESFLDVVLKVEVRLEAARCLLTLIHCEYTKIDKFLVDKIRSYAESRDRATLHGAVLSMGAVKAATAALREFRRSHRDNWEKTGTIIGSQLVYKIENAIAPIYYA
ncbi:hypothetical protein ANCDUO_22742 [Ancylostoma duodenale]|uniref:Proteasome activator complex subunit 4 C-terminal domain-containing protein n=1 Tax=Ancylostoma duodenale TaxID=51022 RepID=A0A0C2FQH6_9BILA|nr:hypothetical protein ANCDUO_22742 [Ancylostoma duodenale]